MPGRPIGQLLDALGVTATVEDGDMPVDALVLMKLVKADGSVALVQGQSETLDWISALGMLTAAQTIENGGYIDAAADEE